MRVTAILLTLIISAPGAPGDGNNHTPTGKNLSQKARSDHQISRETRKTFAEILMRLKRLKAKYLQLAEIERAFLTESQLSYESGHVQCQSKARPCSFSQNACRVTVNIAHIGKREEADLHAAESLLFELADGTYLDVYYGVLAEPTATGKAFESAVNRIISASLGNLRARLASLPHSNHLF